MLLRRARALLMLWRLLSLFEAAWACACSSLSARALISGGVSRGVGDRESDLWRLLRGALRKVLSELFAASDVDEKVARPYAPGWPRLQPPRSHMPGARLAMQADNRLLSRGLWAQ